MKNTDPLILIVEDDVNDQIFIQRALKNSGGAIRVAVVNDGAEAIDYLRGVGPYVDRTLHPLPRLVITDLKMPRMGGIELLAWLSTQEEHRLIPIIVLTSSSNQSDITAAFANGARGYMIKPVRFNELEQIVRVTCDYWRASCVPGIAALGLP